MGAIAKWLTIPWIVKTSYIGMFITMLVEGPVATAFGGFGVRMGFLNIWLVLLFSVLGNFLPDLVLYGVGYGGRTWLVSRIKVLFKITDEKLGVIEKLYVDHPFLTLLVVKMIPFVATTGLVAAGAIRMPFGKFSLWSLLIVIPSSGLYFIIGYYAGGAYVRFVHYQEWAFAGLAILIVLTVFAYQKLMALLGKKFAPSGLVKS